MSYASSVEEISVRLPLASTGAAIMSSSQYPRARVDEVDCLRAVILSQVSVLGLLRQRGELVHDILSLHIAIGIASIPHRSQLELGK